MKKIALATALATTILGLSASSAAASQITVSSIVCPDTYKPTWVAVGSTGDTNRNGAVCVKGKGAIDETYVIKVTVTVASGGCPSGSFAVSATMYPTYDANQNGIVCFNSTGKGSWADDITLVSGISFG